MSTQPHTIAVATSYAPLGRFITLALKMEGYQPHLHSDGEQALDFLLSQSADAAILDADLAKVSGLAVCERLRAVSTIPIVLLLMRGEPRQLVHGRQVGANAFLFIPFGVEELLSCMHAVLPNGESATSAQA